MEAIGPKGFKGLSQGFFHLGVAQNLRARVTQVLGFGSIYQGAILVHVFEPQPFEFVCFRGTLRKPGGFFGLMKKNNPFSASTRKHTFLANKFGREGVCSKSLGCSVVRGFGPSSGFGMNRLGIPLKWVATFDPDRRVGFGTH